MKQRLQLHKHFALLVDNSRWTWTREHSTYCHFLPYEAKSDTERVLNYRTYFKAEHDGMKKAETEKLLFYKIEQRHQRL